MAEIIAGFTTPNYILMVPGANAIGSREAILGMQRFQDIFIG
jgi:hypothetical protein